MFMTVMPVGCPISISIISSDLLLAQCSAKYFRFDEHIALIEVNIAECHGLLKTPGKD